jgi:hypothetical protein
MESITSLDQIFDIFPADWTKTQILEWIASLPIPAWDRKQICFYVASHYGWALTADDYVTAKAEWQRIRKEQQQ